MRLKGMGSSVKNGVRFSANLPCHALVTHMAGSQEGEAIYVGLGTILVILFILILIGVLR